MTRAMRAIAIIQWLLTFSTFVNTDGYLYLLLWIPWHFCNEVSKTIHKREAIGNDCCTVSVEVRPYVVDVVLSYVL